MNFFNKPFTVDFGSPYLNIPPMPIGDSFRPKQITWYTPDTLPASISVAYGNYVGTLTTPYEPPKVNLLNYDDPDTVHIITRDKPGHKTEKRGYYYRLHYGIRHQKNPGSIAPPVIFIKGFINVMNLTHLSQK